MADYMPVRDVEFSQWIGNFGQRIATAGAALGLTPAELTAVGEAIDDWRGDYDVHVAAQQSAAGARARKDTGRRALRKQVRQIVRRLQVHPTMTDATRADLRIRIARPADVGGSGSSALAELAIGRPMVTVDAGQRLRHRLIFRDEATPTRVGKPLGVRGCEVWVRVDDVAAAGPGEMTLLGEVTRTRHVIDYDEPDGGKMAHYALRWIGGRGQKGPWSMTVAATIGA